MDLAQQIESSDGLQFAGLQAFQGAAQHIRDYNERGQVCNAISSPEPALDPISSIAASGLYNEMQCGSYIFMDADYQRVLDDNSKPISEFRNSLFLWTSIRWHARPEMAICDAGLKVQSVDSGLPLVFGRDHVEYVNCSDEHGDIADPHNRLKLNQKLKLVPGHCDPTCNLHDWYVGIRNNKVECLWPLSACDKAF